MKFISFKYLRGQRLLNLALILALASTLFSITAIGLLGFYKGFTAYLGEGEDIVVLYDRNARTPFSGLVPAYLAERIGAVNGVLASSPEVIAPCLVKGEAIFVRGILLESFFKLNRLTLVNGAFPSVGEVNSAVVGRNAAERLGFKLNDKMLVFGVLAERYAEFQVKGIYVSGSAMDDEILVPLYVGQRLRGTDYGHVSLIRFKIDKGLVDPSKIFNEVAKEALQPSPSEEEPTFEEQIIPEVIVRFRIEDVGVEEAAKFMKSYMDRYGLTKEALLILSTVIFLFSSVTITAASKTLIIQHKGEISILRSLGTSERLLKFDIIFKLLPWTLFSSFLGLLSAVTFLTLIQGQGYLQVLSHIVPLQFDPLIVVLNFTLTFTLTSISVLKSEIN